MMARLKRWTTGHVIAAAAVLLIVLAFALSLPYHLRALPGGALPVQHAEHARDTGCHHVSCRIARPVLRAREDGLRAG